MVTIILVGLAIVSAFFTGIRAGLNYRNKIIDEKQTRLRELIAEAKQKNNEMITNYSKIYHATYGTEGKWTDIDDFLMPMWMDLD